MGTYTPQYNLYKPAQGETPYDALVNSNYDILDAQIYSSSLNNLVAVAPISRSGNNISFQYDQYALKVSSNKLTTIQGLSTASSPTFYNATITNDVNIGVGTADQGLLFVSGVIYTRGDIATIGNFYVTGSSWFTGSVFVSESLVTRRFTVNPNSNGSAAGAGAEIPPAGYDMLVSGSAIFSGSIKANIVSASQMNGNSSTMYGDITSLGNLWLVNSLVGHAERLYVAGTAEISGALTRKTKSISAFHGVFSGISQPTDDIQEGDTYYNSTSAKVYFRASSSWVALN